MAYRLEEQETLKKLLKEIIDEHYLPVVHELRKKLTILESRDQDQIAKLTGYEEELKQYRKCHECHRLINITHDASIQFPESQEPATTETKQGKCSIPENSRVGVRETNGYQNGPTDSKLSIIREHDPVDIITIDSD